jgi:hypothetical protein
MLDNCSIPGFPESLVRMSCFFFFYLVSSYASYHISKTDELPPRSSSH